MNRDFSALRLDVAAFAAAAGELSGDEPIARWPRLQAELVAEADAPSVVWHARGEVRSATGVAGVPWVRLEASTRAALVCQRCLGVIEQALQVDRWFRFVADETVAAAEDEQADDEDVLAISTEFDLHALVEDELLMALPVVARHEQCPDPVPLSAVDPDFELAQAARPRAFAILDQLKTPKAD